MEYTQPILDAINRKRYRFPEVEHEKVEVRYHYRSFWKRLWQRISQLFTRRSL